MRVLVTGGAGFVGSHLVDRLLAGGDAVTVVDDLSTGSLDNLEAARRVNLHRRGAFTFHHADVAAPGLDDIVRTAAPEVVHHLADRPRKSAQDAATGTVLGSVAVLSAAVAAGARRVVYAGSGAVYGLPSRQPVGERAGLDPRTPAAAGDAAVEPYLRAFRRCHGLDWTVLVLAEVYGPRQQAGVVAALVADLIAGRTPTVDPSTHDLVSVQDVVDAFVLAGSGAAAGRRLNVGGGAATGLRELRELLAEALGVAAPPLPAAPPPEPTGSGIAAASSPVLEIRAARQIGWAPHTPLVEGLAETAAWVRAFSTAGARPRLSGEGNLS